MKQILIRQFERYKIYRNCGELNFLNLDINSDTDTGYRTLYWLVHKVMCDYC